MSVPASSFNFTIVAVAAPAADVAVIKSVLSFVIGSVSSVTGGLKADGVEGPSWTCGSASSKLAVVDEYDDMVDLVVCDIGDGGAELPEVGGIEKEEGVMRGESVGEELAAAVRTLVKSIGGVAIDVRKGQEEKFESNQRRMLWKRVCR